MVKTMLDCQERAYNNALELFLKQVYEKIQSFSTTVKELTRSLEFTQSEVDELRREANHLKNDKEEAKEKLRIMTEDFHAKKVKIEDLEEKAVYQGAKSFTLLVWLSSLMRLGKERHKR